MGMDLYKYVIENKGDERTYIGTNLPEKSLEKFSNFNVVMFEEIDMGKAFDEIKKRFKINDNPDFWDLSIDEQLPYTLYLNDKYKKIYSEFDKKYSEIEDKQERLKLLDEQSKFEKDVVGEIKKYNETDKTIETKYGLLILPSGLPTEKIYYIKGNAEEVFYARKPFRHHSTPSKSENGTTIFYIDNFTGTQEDKLQALYEKCDYNGDDSFFGFTKAHEAEDAFLECIPDENKDYLKKMFPLKDNEFVSIDW